MCSRRCELMIQSLEGSLTMVLVVLDEANNCCRRANMFHGRQGSYFGNKKQFLRFPGRMARPLDQAVCIVRLIRRVSASIRGRLHHGRTSERKSDGSDDVVCVSQHDVSIPDDTCHGHGSRHSESTSSGRASLDRWRTIALASLRFFARRTNAAAGLPFRVPAAPSPLSLL